MISGDRRGLVVVLGTGGTIAGVSTNGDDQSYQAAQLGVDQLVGAVQASTGLALEAHQVAQVDSKDMGWPVWRVLLQALGHHLSREDVAGVVITHGTDTLEETALMLHLLLPAGKPVVLTAAMRPATSLEADGPANLADAVRVANSLSVGQRGGVAVMMAGRLWAAPDLRKAHTWHIDAFDGGGAEPVALMANGRLTWSQRPWGGSHGWLNDALLALPALPRVEILTSHADADGSLVDALLTGARPDGLVVSCTGNGTLHQGLQAALARADAQGVAVWRSTRVPQGGVGAKPHDRWPSAGGLTPAQARVALSVALAVRPDLALLAWDRWPAA